MSTTKSAQFVQFSTFSNSFLFFKSQNECILIHVGCSWFDWWFEWQRVSLFYVCVRAERSINRIDNYTILSRTEFVFFRKITKSRINVHELTNFGFNFGLFYYFINLFYSESLSQFSKLQTIIRQFCTKSSKFTSLLQVSLK